MGIPSLEFVVSALTPLECRICKAESYMLCPPCVEKIIPNQISRCYICNKLTSQQRICISCRSKSSIRRVWWLGIYENTLKELIFMMKYQRKHAYARSFGELLADRIPYLPDDTLVISAPTAPNEYEQEAMTRLN